MAQRDVHCETVALPVVVRAQWEGPGLQVAYDGSLLGQGDDEVSHSNGVGPGEERWVGPRRWGSYIPSSFFTDQSGTILTNQDS